LNTLARFKRICDEIDDTGQVWHSKSNLLLVVSYPRLFFDRVFIHFEKGYGLR
jgi:hypothetical protein